MPSFYLFFLVVLVLASRPGCTALVAPQSRRDWTAAALGTMMTGTMIATTSAAWAGEDNVTLTDDEMAAKVAKKLALLNGTASSSGSSGGSGAGSSGFGADLPTGAMNIRSDINPEAGQNLRSKTSLENMQLALEKQKELKNRSKTQKRDDLCEMLGRGC